MSRRGIPRKGDPEMILADPGIEMAVSDGQSENADDSISISSK
jgi:hypothetical protein